MYSFFPPSFFRGLSGDTSKRKAVVADRVSHCPAPRQHFLYADVTLTGGNGCSPPGGTPADSGVCPCASLAGAGSRILEKAWKYLLGKGGGKSSAALADPNVTSCRLETSAPLSTEEVL